MERGIDEYHDLFEHNIQELIRAARQRRLAQVHNTLCEPPVRGLEDSSSAGGNSGTTAEIDRLVTLIYMARDPPVIKPEWRKNNKKKKLRKRKSDIGFVPFSPPEGMWVTLG